MPDRDSGDGWNEYQRLVLADLERHSARIESLETKLTEGLAAIRVDIATLNLKSGVWGALSGLIPVVLAMVAYMMSRMFSGSGK